MKLRKTKYYCPKCDQIQDFTELEVIRPKTTGSSLLQAILAEETGIINPYFICNKCDYSEKQEYLEYPSRKPAATFINRTWKKLKGEK